MYSTIRIAICAAALVSIVACEKKPQTLGEKIEDKIGDATDSRPHEKLKDAAEDVKDAGRDAKDAVKDAVKR